MQNNNKTNSIDMSNESLQDAYKGIPTYCEGNGMYNFNSIADYGRACIKHGANWQKEKDKAVIERLIEALKETNAALNKIIETGKKENNHVNFFLFDSWCNDIHLANEKAKELLSSIEKDTLI